MAQSEYTSITVNVLRLSESGKAIEVLDAERPKDDQTLWIPVSQIEESSFEAIDYNTMGMTDLEVKTWMLEKEGWA